MNKLKPIKIVQLYPNDMNIYGDYGNVLTLQKRLEWHGYQPIVTAYNQADTSPKDADIIIGGGGQDSGQSKIKEDLIKIGPNIKQLAENNIPMLVICGLYQLFGNYFKTSDGQEIPGIGLFDIKTIAESERLIGNIIINSQKFGEIIGYENHSGQTFLSDGVQPLGIVKKGFGNNSLDKTEGTIYKNVIGSYLHGPILPKNPVIADFLIEQAAINRYGQFDSKIIDDSLAEKAKQIAAKRPR